MAFDTVTSEMNVPWYLVYCIPGKELYAAKALSEILGIHAYCPQVRGYTWKMVRPIPFFPGYIFIQVDLQNIPPSQINTIPGVIRLVEFDGDLQPVPGSLIKEIFERLEHQEVANHPAFHSGDIVRHKHSVALAGLDMIFVGEITPGQRASVLFNILGRLTRVHVDIRVLEKVDSGVNEATRSGQVQEKERYTRGKGRKIKKFR